MVCVCVFEYLYAHPLQKFSAYSQLKLRDPVIWIKPADPTPKGLMVAILGQNTNGLRVLEKYGPKDP